MAGWRCEGVQVYIIEQLYLLACSWSRLFCAESMSCICGLFGFLASASFALIASVIPGQGL